MFIEAFFIIYRASQKSKCQWITKQNAEYLQRPKWLVHSSMYINIKIMPSDRSQTQKNAYSFLEIVKKCKLVYRDKKQISGSPGSGTEGHIDCKEYVEVSFQEGLQKYLLQVFPLLWKPLPQSSGLVCMTNRVWQKWWYAISQIRILKTTTSVVGSLLVTFQVTPFKGSQLPCNAEIQATYGEAHRANT